MNPRKFARICDGCERAVPSRFRTICDRYLCAGCYAAALVHQQDEIRIPQGVPASSPEAVGAGQTGRTRTVTASTVPAGEPEFDLRHLTGAK